MEYFGAINEVKMRARAKAPEKPGYLEAYYRIREFKVFPEPGGLMDQGHLWLLEYERIDQIVKMFEHLEIQAQQDANHGIQPESIQ